MMALEWLHMMDTEGRTPLDRAMNSGHRAIAEMLLRQEKEDEAEADGTLMHRAAKLGLTAAVHKQMSYGFDAMRADNNGDTPLHLAVREGNIETVRVLLDASDVNQPNNQGLTPLHWASLRGDEELCTMLLEYGADPDIRDEHLDGLSPIHVAKVMEYQEVSEALAAASSFY